MKATYKGVEFDIENTEDIDMLLSHASGQKVEVKKEVVEKAEKESKRFVNIPVFASQENGKKRNNKRWTSEEHKWLMENKGTLPMGVLARSLGRKADAVRQRIRFTERTGSAPTYKVSKEGIVPIKKKHRHQQVSKATGEKIKQSLIQMVSVGMPRKDIAEKLGIPERYVSNKAYALRKAGLIGDAPLKRKKKYHHEVSVEKGRNIVPQIIKMVNDGATHKDIREKLGLSKRYTYDKIYFLRKKGLISKAKLDRYDKKQDKKQEEIRFDFVPMDRQAMFKDFLLSCHKNKASLSTQDLIAYGGVAMGEVKSLMIDIFNQQKKIGYKVEIKNDKLVFNNGNN